jgi:hypothetical protein
MKWVIDFSGVYLDFIEPAAKKVTISFSYVKMNSMDVVNIE